MTDRRAHQLKDALHEHLVGLMIDALKKEAMLHFTDDEFYRLKDALRDALLGKVRT